MECGIKYQFTITAKLKRDNEFIFDTVRAYDLEHAKSILVIKYPHLEGIDLTGKIYFNPVSQRTYWKDYLPEDQRAIVKPPYSFAEREDGL